MRQSLFVFLGFILAQPKKRPASGYFRIENRKPPKGRAGLFVPVLVVKHRAEVPPGLFPFRPQVHPYVIQALGILPPLVLARLRSLLGNLRKSVGGRRRRLLRPREKQQCP